MADTSGFNSAEPLSATVNVLRGMGFAAPDMGSASFAEAMGKRFHAFDASMYDDVAYYAIGFGIFIGGWVAGVIVEYVLWYVLMFNWRRLCCGRRKGQPVKPWNKHYNDHDESANHPKHLPQPGKVESIQLVEVVSSLIGEVPQLRSVGARTGETQGTRSQPFVRVDVEKATDTNRWHGHRRSRYESYVRLIVLSIRVAIVMAGVVFAFRAAGVNILSLAASLGVISICFSYGAAAMLSNILSALYMYGTDKIEMRDFVACEGRFGMVTAFRAQWSEITDDLHPWQGRRVHQIPNKTLINSLVTVYPGGPPPELVRTYFEELKTLNAWRKSEMNLPPIPPIEFSIASSSSLPSGNNSVFVMNDHDTTSTTHSKYA